MSDLTACVSLRYRPGADVLSGQIDLPRLGPDHTITESPDADTTIEWANAVDGADGQVVYLSSFNFVHASARLQRGTIPLPVGLTATVRTLIDTALQSIAEVDSPLAKVHARAEASAELTLEALRRDDRPERPPGRQRADPQQAIDLADSLTRLANAVDQQAPVDDEPTALHTEHSTRLLRELSSTISHGRGGTAPGTSAATRAAVSGDIRLTAHQQRVLNQALGDLDDPVTWHVARHSFDQLAEALEHTDHQE